MLYVGLTSGNLFYLAPNFLMVFLAAYAVERIVSGRQPRITNFGQDILEEDTTARPMPVQGTVGSRLG